MKTRTSLILAGALLAAGVGMAHAQDGAGAGAYVGGEIGNAHWNNTGAANTSDRFNYGVQGGYRWSINNQNALGVELGYVDFGRVAGGDGAGTTASARANAWTLGPSYRYTFNNSGVYLSGRAGYERTYSNARVVVDGVGSIADSGRGNGYYAGVGVGYDLTHQVSVQAGYDYHRFNSDALGDHQNIGVASVGAEYRF
jgi:OmpA-OmpF porin, OOP family